MRGHTHGGHTGHTHRGHRHGGHAYRVIYTRRRMKYKE